MDRYKKLISNSIIFALGNFGSKFIIFLLLPIYTRYLSPTQYGETDLVQTTISLLLPIITLSIYEAVLRFAMDSNSHKNIVLTNGVVVTVLGCFVGVTISIFLSFFHIKYSLYLSLILGAQAFQMLFSQYAKAIGKVKIYAANGILLSVFMFLINILCLVVLKLEINGYFISLLVSNVLSCLYLFVRLDLSKDIKFGLFNRRQLKDMWQYSIPLIPNSIAWFATNAINRYFILYMIGSSANGIFAVANKIPTMLSVVNSIFFQSWQLSVIEEFEAEDKGKYYSQVFSYYSDFMFLGVTALMLFLKPIMRILVSEEFFSAWKYVPFLLLTVLYSSFSGFLGQYYVAAKKTNGLFFTTLIGAIVNVLLNMILIPIFGLNGAAISSAISFLLIWISRQIDTQKFISTTLQINRMVSNHVVFFVQLFALYFASGLLTYVISAICLLLSIFINRSFITALIEKIFMKRTS